MTYTRFLWIILELANSDLELDLGLLPAAYLENSSQGEPYSFLLCQSSLIKTIIIVVSAK
jgi:hypothetical protein